jgi:uncharacterized protein YqgV (UPF0045/DUF77 family)
MTVARLEMLVEPFKENDPGPHVTAVVDAATAAGLDVDMGPFATTVESDLDSIIDAATAMLRAGFANGATSIQLRVDTR